MRETLDAASTCALSALPVATLIALLVSCSTYIALALLSDAFGSLDSVLFHVRLVQSVNGAVCSAGQSCSCLGSNDEQISLQADGRIDFPVAEKVNRLTNAIDTLCKKLELTPLLTSNYL